MKYELPNEANPFKEQSELAIAWELGWMKRNEDVQQYFVESSRWSVEFRQNVRNALFPFYPNNPCSTDDELIEAVHELVKLVKKPNLKE
jgi:SRSO17 transposase